MQKNSTVDFINKVIRNYGLNEYNEPIFRVVFSEDQIEKRKGTFNEYYGNLFVRTVKEIREVQKYPWIRSKWIIERWASGGLSYHPDLETDKNGVYVCVYVFQDFNGNYLPPLLKIAEIVIKHLLNPPKRIEAINRDIEEEKKSEENEINQIMDNLTIESDEVARKDPKSSRESMSVGYTGKEKYGKR